MLGTTTTLSMLFQVLELWSLVRILLDFKLGLAVTEININFQINIKKVLKQEIKNIKNVKDAGMACQKVCKQGRDDA